MLLCRFIVLAIAVVGGVLLAPTSAFAHDMNAKVTVGEEVKVVAYFEDEPAEHATMTVTDATGKEIVAGKADEHGVWTFPRPAPGQYTLTAKCIGHTATVPFRVEGEPDAPPVEYTGWRLPKAVGIAVGLALIFGISVVSWFIRRQRRG